MKTMKSTQVLLSFLITILCCCENNDDLTKRSSYIIAGDSLNCTYINYIPDLVFDSSLDSIDITDDYRKDVEFSTKSLFIDTCEAYLANCPPNVICDCLPTIYTDYIITLANSMEIAIDNDSTIHEFVLNDTISNLNKWSKTVKYPLYHRNISDPNWTGAKEYILGLRVAQVVDTLYSWLRMEIDNSGFIIKDVAIQK